MNILIINQYSAITSKGFQQERHIYIAKELVSLGHKVAVVAARNHHYITCDEFIKRPQIENLYGFRFIRLNVIKYKNSYDKKRILASFCFAFKLLFIKRYLSFKPDIIIYSSPSLIGFLTAELLSNIFSAKLVFDVRDLWPLSLTTLGDYSTKHPFIRFLQWIENRACAKSDLITSNLFGAIEHLKAHGLDEARFLWVPNGVNYQINKTDQLLEQNISGINLSKHSFNITFIGNMGKASNLLPVIKSVFELQKQNVRLYLAGSGPELHRLQRFVEQQGITNVAFLGQLPKSEILNLLSQTDICIQCTKNSPIYQYGIASIKLFDYFLASKPVLHCYSGKHDPVRLYNAGLSINSDNVKSIVNAIVSLKKLTEYQRKELGNNGFNAILTTHNYYNITRNLELRLTKL